MRCPRDKSNLESEVYEADIEVDVCPSCRGMWLDKGELEKIEEVHEHDYTEELKLIPNYIGNAYEMARQKMLSDINCPRCGGEMSHREYAYCSQIIIDVCPNCEGIWLDEGELKALEIFFEKARIEEADIRRGFWKSLMSLF